MAGYVICAECGSRIKANREHCLRCGEPLRGLEPPAPPLPMHEALGVSEGVFRVLAAVAALAVVGVAVLMWEWRPRPIVDEVAQPLGSIPERKRLTPPSSPPGGSSDAAAVTPPLEPTTSADAPRRANGSLTVGDSESAKNDLEKAVEKNPSDHEALNNLGQALVRLGRIAEAVPRFERAVTLAPDKWAYRFNLAHAVGETGQWDRAIKEYRAALKIQPADHATQYNLALAIYKKGDSAAAIPEFERAITLAPTEASVHLSLAMALEKVGRVDDAVREYRRFLELDPVGRDAAKVKEHIELLTTTQPSGRGARLSPQP
jgi:Flp pilus assembly protein TadD